MTMRRLATPWASPGDRQFSLPTSLILKMGLGEAPENIPYIRDVSRKVMAAATSIDGGAVDRIANEHSGGFRCRTGNRSRPDIHFTSAGRNRRRATVRDACANQQRRKRQPELCLHHSFRCVG